MALKNRKEKIIKTDRLKYCVCHNGERDYWINLKSELGEYALVIDSFTRLADAKKFAISLIKENIVSFERLICNIKEIKK